MFVFRYLYTLVESLAEEPMERRYHLWDYDWTPLSQNTTHAEWHISIPGALIGLGGLVPQHPCWQAYTGVPKGAPPCALGPGSGAKSPPSWDTGCSQKGSHHITHHGTPICREPGAKSFIDDLILVWDFLCSRAAPLLLSTESFNNLPVDANSWLIGKDYDAGKDWGQKEKRMSEAWHHHGIAMAWWHGWHRWHHQCNIHELEQTLGDGEGQGSLVCCSPRGHNESDTTWWLNNSTFWFP